MFTMDGINWQVPCDITRIAEIKESSNSGMMLNGVQFSDRLGTYLRYEVSIIPDPQDMGAYYAFRQALIQPVDHTFVMPYDDTKVTITAKVSQVPDIYVRLPNGGRYWKGIKFTVESIAPTYQESLDEVIARGLPPLPDVSEPQIGDTYTYTAHGWTRTDSYPDADDIYY